MSLNPSKAVGPNSIPIKILKLLINNVSSQFVDLQKAFDTVDQDILIQKLNHCCIRGVANNWFSS